MRWYQRHRSCQGPWEPCIAIKLDHLVWCETSPLLLLSSSLSRLDPCGAVLPESILSVGWLPCQGLCWISSNAHMVKAAICQNLVGAVGPHLPEAVSRSATLWPLDTLYRHHEKNSILVQATIYCTLILWEKTLRESRSIVFNRLNKICDIHQTSVCITYLLF